MPKSECQIAKDENLITYDSIEEMLCNEFYPGNLNPNRYSIEQTLRAACLSTAQWVKLRIINHLKSVIEETGESFTVSSINEVIDLLEKTCKLS